MLRHNIFSSLFKAYHGASAHTSNACQRVSHQQFPTYVLASHHHSATISAFPLLTTNCSKTSYNRSTISLLSVSQALLSRKQPDGCTHFHTSAPLGALPPKKKKRADPQVELMRLTRKKRRIDREVRYLKRNELKLKPIEEICGERSFVKTLSQRSRVPSNKDEITSNNANQDHKISDRDMVKEWTHYQFVQYRVEARKLNAMHASQQRALDELKKVSPRLYAECVRVDVDSFLPIRIDGPRRSPPIASFKAVDGDYKDVTKRFEGGGEQQIMHGKDGKAKKL